MQSVIYIDVLVFLNIILTFLLLLSASRMMKIVPSPIRFALGSLVGGISSIIILAPDMGLILSIITKLLFSSAIVIVTFNPKSAKALLRETGFFFGVNFVFAGIMMFISSLPGINLMQFNNGVIYVSFSFISLIVSSGVCFLITCLLSFITKRKYGSGKIYDIKIVTDKGVADGSALLDTGNKLTDPFTGECVIIANRELINNILPDNINKWFEYGSEKCTGIRLIPFSTVSSEGLMPCFRAKEVHISYSGKPSVMKNIEVAVSIKNTQPEIILPAELIDASERRSISEKAVH